MSNEVQYAPIPSAVRSDSDRRSALWRRAKIFAYARVRAMGPRLRRTLDVLCSAGALLALSPLLLMVIVGIKLQDGGPAFYHQERLGRGGRRFKLWKFRTMIQNADALKTALAQKNPEAMSGVRFKMTNDPRVTKLGRILRRFSIDEMPQIYNVLIGDMTLVGPRPPVWREVNEYSLTALRRLEVTPGLTCLWQIGGRSDLTFEQQVALDLQYIDTVPATEEVLIVLKTIPAVISGKGAY